MHLLLIEDDSSVREDVLSYFKKESISIDSTPCGEHGSFLGTAKNYDLIILEQELPKKKGSDICKYLRTQGKTIPIMMITALSSLNDKLAAFNAGVDDYLTKPFHIEELHARVKALLRRPRELCPTVISIGGVTIDIDRHAITCKRKKVYLTKKEFCLLEFMARNKGLVVSREKLLDHVWDGGSHVSSNTIEMHILSLRKKLGSEGRKIIQTVPACGYKLESPRHPMMY